MEVRERFFLAAIGAAGHGKSTYISGLAKRYAGHVMIYKHPANIMDKAFAAYPEISYTRYDGGKVKINAGEIKYKPFLKWVMGGGFKNGLLIIDDTTNYERNYISDELNELLTMRRHFGIDVMLVYHGLTGFPIDQFKFVDGIILFNTTDIIDYKKGKINNFDALQEAKERITQQVQAGNKYYFEYVRMNAA